MHHHAGRERHEPHHVGPEHHEDRQGGPDHDEHRHGGPEHHEHPHAGPDHHEHPPGTAEHHSEHHEESGLLGHLPFFHQHSHDAPTVDAALEGSSEGLRTLTLSLAGLALTALVQLAVAIASGSAGLLADTIHNGADALTALPLGLAFLAGRRPPTRRYPYGFGRAEDLAGVLIVLIILASALFAALESVGKLRHPVPVEHAWWVALAAVVGFLGNETVAALRIRTGRRIGSAALIADGQHARVDGITSLAVLVGVLLSVAGLPLADPVVGLLITAIILLVVRDSAATMWYRLMDAVDPDLIDRIEDVAASVNGVQGVGEARARHIGHKIFADVRILIDGQRSAASGHAVAEEVQHALLHEIPRLAEAHVHVDPAGVSEAHALTEPHQARAGS